ncbi:MAG: response regulator, partial [bacterium]
MTNLKFLVIEDDLFYQNYVNDLLAESGIDIVNAADGETGLQLALSEKPDLIITDIEIPRIQGFVLLKNLRDRPGTKDIPVIMMSGKVEKDMLDRHAKLRVRADGYLLKPFSGQDLLNKINEVLGPESGFAYKEEPSQAFPVENGPGTEEQVQVFEGTDEKIPGQPAKDRTLNALIVDDSQYICDIARDFLQEMGFNVIIAKDGEEGLEVALDVVPDLVLLDVQMPKMNGFVVCEKLRKEDSTGNVPIILMSAVVDDESFQRHSKLRYRADAYLQKPFMKSELQDLARQFTSIRGPKPSDVESKTGFLVPSEEELRRAEGTDKKAGPARVDAKVAEELKKAKAALETLRSRESSLTGQLEAMKNERDRMEEEVYRITSQAENTEKQLSDKLTLATQRLDEMRASLQRAQEEEGEAAQGEAAAGADDVISGLREQLSEAAAENEALRGELEGVRSELQSLSMEKEEQAPDEELQARTKEALESAETLRSENASLKAEIDELKASKAGEGDAEDSAAALQEKIRFLEEGKAGLTRDLKAAVAAKNEIEDQVKTILKRREGEPDAEELKGELAQVRDQVKELTNRAAEAESRTKWLADVQSQLEKAQEENRELRQRLQDVDDSTEAEVTTMRDKLAAAQAMAESLQEGKDQISSLLEERSSLVEELQTELNRSRKLAASETEARMELEGKLKSLREEKKVLASRLEEAHRELDEAPVGKASESGLEERLEEEGRLRAKAESEAVKLRRDLEKVTLEKDRLEELGR